MSCLPCCPGTKIIGLQHGTKLGFPSHKRLPYLATRVHRVCVSGADRCSTVRCYVSTRQAEQVNCMVKVVITSTLRKYVCKQTRVGTNKPISRYRFKAEYQCICYSRLQQRFFWKTHWYFFHSDFTSYINHCVRHISWCLSHWGRVTHICVSKLTIIGSDNGLSPGRRQAIIWTNAGILLIRPIETNFSEILLKIHTFSFKKSHLLRLYETNTDVSNHTLIGKISYISGIQNVVWKMAAILSRPQCVIGVTTLVPFYQCPCSRCKSRAL